jgi:hypothetical protein
MVSRYPGGYAVPRCTAGMGVSPIDELSVVIAQRLRDRHMAVLRPLLRPTSRTALDEPFNAAPLLGNLMQSRMASPSWPETV